MLNEQQKRALIQVFRDDISAEVFESDALSPFTVQTITLDLSVARSIDSPYSLPFPLKSVFLKSAVGGTGQIFMRLNSQDSGLSWIPLDNNDTINLSRMAAGADFYWTAQGSGKTATLLVSTTAEFSSGSLINSGTVAVTPSSTLTTSRPALSAATAASLSASSLVNFRVTIQNRSAESIFLGESIAVTNAGATCGFELFAGQSIEYPSRAAVFGYSVGAQAAGQIIVVAEA